MPDDKKQPTILVKKSDGTTVRMTLAEVQAMKKGEKHAKPHAQKKHETAAPKAPAPQQALATTAPVTKIFVDEAKASQAPKAPAPPAVRRPEPAQPAKQWQKTDASSPLEEKQTEKSRAPEVAKPAEMMMEDTPIGPAKDVVEKVLKKTGWDISDATRNRLAPLILSRVKDVRTDGQFLVHAMTPTHRGGMGLSPAQGEQLLAAIQTFLPKTSAIGLQNRTSDFSDQTSANDHSRSPKSEVRPVMRDITPPRAVPQQMGPKEEFAAFSLADFKRLGATTDASLSRLKEKFDTLKAESHVLFLDVRDAWFESPLVIAYVESALTALRDKKRLADVLAPAGAKEGVTEDIVKAIVEVNKYISI